MKQQCAEQGLSAPVFLEGTVFSLKIEDTARPKGSVFRLTIRAPLKTSPLPGQFFMLRAKRSAVLLSRPISVFLFKEENGEGFIDFLILKKGAGTIELSELNRNEKIELLGPLGNCFPIPLSSNKKIAILGGGVGVAPVAGFASTLPSGSFDFFAAFKSGFYALDEIKSENLFLTTEDGSKGEKGMISALFTEEKAKEYSAVYACGPAPMLSYVQKTCQNAGVKSYLSLENRMACGVGACLGCSISTKEGQKRVCKDGPVFEGDILIFESPKSRPLKNVSEEIHADLSVEIAGVTFQNPVIAASGTFGYGSEYEHLIDVDLLGGICSKGLTEEPRAGNMGVRLYETSGGLINSIGLENPGIDHFIEHEMQTMLSKKCVSIANLSGFSVDGYVRGAKKLDSTNMQMIELNISCPNVHSGGMAFGLEAKAAAEVTKAVRSATKKPLIVKLSPNAPHLIDVALSVLEAGADAISLVNTFQALAIDVETGKPVFDNIRAGLCGPAIKPLALRMCYDVVQAINRLDEKKRVPVIALGGIEKWQDAVEFILSGAHAIQVGTATFKNPKAMTEIIDGIRAYMKRKGFRSLSDFRGMAQNC